MYLLDCNGTFEQMLGNLGKVFDRLKKANLKLKAKKCCLFAKKVVYLGHVVSEEELATDTSKIATVNKWPVPYNVTKLRSFLELCEYYRIFIKGFTVVAKCLHRLTEKGRPFAWTIECQKAFELLKSYLMNSPIGAHPYYSTIYTRHGRK